MAEPTIRVPFVYFLCNDVAPMRAFYTDVLGLEEASYQREEGGFGWLSYVAGSDLQLMFFHFEGPLPIEQGWAWQPGGFDLPEGARAIPAASFSVSVPEASFADAVERIRSAGTSTQTAWPQWRQDSYWGYTVHDPMGTTIEVYCKVTARPAGDPPTWPA